MEKDQKEQTVSLVLMYTKLSTNRDYRPKGNPLL